MCSYQLRCWVKRSSPHTFRLNLKRWQERGFCVVAWTVNSKEDKDYFQNVLNLPFLTDAVSPDSSALEQGGH